MIDPPAAIQPLGQASAACESGSCAAGLSAVDVFALAADRAAAGRLVEAEALLRALARDPHPAYRAEAQFRLGKLRERQGDRAGAITAYRALLAEQPGATRVRLDLARLLALDGDEAGARRELRTAGTGVLPEEVARAVDRFSAALRSRRPIGATIEVAIAPDSNINASTSQRSVETIITDLPLSRDARATSGVGLSLSGQAFARVPIAGLTLLSRLAGRADLYGRSRFDDVSATVAAGPEIQSGWTRLRPAIIAGKRWYGERPYSTSIGGTINLLRPIGARTQVEADLTVLESDYAVAAQDGASYDVSTTLDRALSPVWSARLSARITRQQARDPGFATTAGALEMLLARQWNSQTAFVQAAFSRTEADERLFLFPERRRDRRWDVTAGIVARGIRIRGLSPLVRITYSRSSSSVALYQFSRTRVEFALSREF